MKRTIWLAAVLALVLTLSACGEKDEKRDDAGTTGTDRPAADSGYTADEDDISPGDSMNGGHNNDGGAVPGDGAYSTDGSNITAGGRSRATGYAATGLTEYEQMLRNGRVTDTDGFLDNDR